MHTFKKIILTTIVFFLSVSCDKETNSIVEINIQALHNEGEYIFGEEITDVAGNTILFDRIKFYMSNFKAFYNDENTGHSDDIILYDSRSTSSHFITIFSDQKELKSLNFDIGLNSTLNNSNPKSFNNEHPLSIEQNMFWDMLKYRFVTLEGNYTEKDSIEEKSFSFHLGTEALLRNATIDNNINVNENTIVVQVTFEVLDLFDNIDITKHFSNHSENEEALVKGNIILDNLVSSIEAGK